MFFYLSKLFWVLASPTNAMLLLGVGGLALAGFGYRRWGLRLAAMSILGLIVAGAAPVEAILTRPLEDRFPAYQDDGRPVTGIIVLGGAIGIVRDRPSFNDLAARMTEAAALALKHPEAKIVFAGGTGDLIREDDLTEADGARTFFNSLGIPDGRIVYENESRNTRENALFASRLVTIGAGEKWLLVTSAFHMPRAMGCFRVVGLDVVPHPVDYRTEGDARDLKPRRSISGGLSGLDLIVKEWIGLVAYRLAGYTSALLPGP